MKNSNFIILFLITFFTSIESFIREKRYVEFPKTGAMGLFLAVSVPVGSARNNVFMAYNFEATYNLPYNETIEGDGLNWQTVDATEARSKIGFNRTIAYKLLESKMENHGYPGQACLLRTICELSASSIEHNGVLGEILKVVFEPSTSEDEQLPKIYNQAETDGKTYGICTKYHSKCGISILDMVSWMGI